MRTLPQIGNSFWEQMNLILEFVCHFDVEHLLYAINGKRFNEEDIVSITLDIKSYHVRLQKQKEYLFKFGQTFNKKYAHDDNKFFDTCARVSWKIRSGTAGAKQVFKRFCKVVRKKLPEGTPNPQAHSCSLISSPNYMGSLFGLSTYLPCVRDLFEVMLGFYEDLNDCIMESMRIMKEEEAVREDHKKCWKLLEEACEKSHKAQLHLIEALEENPDLKKAVLETPSLSGEKENPVLKEYKHAGNMEDFAAAYFHNCSPKDISKITLHKAYAEADEDPGMMLAMTVFGKDKEHIQRVNHIIDRFDELLPDKCKRSKIPALHLFFFMDWCNPLVGVESFLNYFNKRYQESGGKWEVIGASALNGAKGKYNSGKAKDEGEKVKTGMMKKLTEMLSRSSSQKKIG